MISIRRRRVSVRETRQQSFPLRLRFTIPLAAVLSLSAGANAGHAASPIACVNVEPGSLPSLTATAQAAGMTLAAGGTDSAPSGPLLIWQIDDGDARITAERAAKISEYVRSGGSVLITLGSKPGDSPMRLGFMMPSVAWKTRRSSTENAAFAAAVESADGDENMFGTEPVSGIHLSYFYGIQPFAAVERGEARYDGYERTIPLLMEKVGPNIDFWTRPLLNRDWQVRLRGNDVAQSPLLVTGRYGAGRVALFAGSIQDLDRAAAGHVVEAGILRYLTQTTDTAAAKDAAIGTLTPTVTVDAPARMLHVTLRNPSAGPLPVQVVARLMTWEPALIGDRLHAVVLPASGEAVVDIPLPPVDATSYQALAARDAYTVRIGVLSSSGAQIMGETRVRADLRPSTQVSLATDNIDAIPNPFHAPGTSLIASRMGMPVGAYAYKPGQTLHASVTVSDGARNIASLAQVTDETQPDNVTLAALTDGSAEADKIPNEGITAYGAWTGKEGAENVLRFTFPHPVTLSSVVLIGTRTDDERNVSHNPGAVVIEADGKAIADVRDLDARFAVGSGQTEIAFPPVTVTTLRLRLPWVATNTNTRSGNRQAPSLGEALVYGVDGILPPAIGGKVTLTLHDALSGTDTPVGSAPVAVEPGARASVSLPVTLPTDANLRFLRLEAKFDDEGKVTAAAPQPVLVIDPPKTLLPAEELHPDNAPSLGFIVTRGFRNCFDLGTGTAEIHPGWGQPDDLVWAYSRAQKQVGKSARMEAGRLYLSDDDFRHYSTCWDTFLNGEELFPLSMPNFIALMKKQKGWSSSEIVHFGFSDRWDTGPSVEAMYNWQDFVAFDEYLRAQGLPGLKGKTKSALVSEIESQYASRWQSFQLTHYIENVKVMHDGFAAAGKTLAISAQGVPVVPIEDQAFVAKTIRGSSDDISWAMQDESVPLTTGRQMGYMAFNPVWQMSTILQWGYNSGELENPHWHAAVGTTEPTRRQYYDRAWRGIVGMDGMYRSMHTYGYNTNAGEAFTMTDNDYQQWWNLAQRHSLIYPDAPIGAGLIIGTAEMSDPAHAFFSGAALNGAEAHKGVMGVANVVRQLHDAGVSVPFTTNVATLSKWSGNTPILLLNLSQFTKTDVAALSALSARGVRMAAFAGTGPLSASAARLFGVTTECGADGAQIVGECGGKAILAQKNTVLIPGSYQDFTPDAARQVAATLRERLQQPITYPAGTAGYGFVSQGKSFIEIEDWRELGRTVSVRLRASEGAQTAHACDINDHRTLAVRREGADWVIDLPLRPGDGDVICVEENK